MSSKDRVGVTDAILQRQLDWAGSRKRAAGRPDYLSDLSDNLFMSELSDQTRLQIAKGDGAELKPRKTAPPKMHALISSSALAVNAFDYWTNRDRSVLQQMLGLQSEIAGMKFEHPCNKHPTGPKKPNIDVMLSLADGSVVAIESKFTEPFGSGKRSLAEKYFKDQLWLKQRLPACQRLADAMRESWFHLDTPQLLKHMLGLAHEYPDGKCTLLYLWFDPQTEEAADHANEVARLEREIAGDRIQFVAKTYQQAFALAPASAVRQHRDYFRYMLDRYGLKTGR